MMTKFAAAFLLCLSLALGACRAQSQPAADANPACPGFDSAGSDPKAIAIADEVMQALGGRAAWDKARVLCWNFFGRRSHVWDRQTGDYRLEEGNKVILMNLETGKGRVYDHGAEITDAKEIEAELKRARSVWINDSYWLLMPYKLKDSGLTLKYSGEGDLADGRKADVLELSFQAVGDTPDNRYLVFVARDTHLVERWQYFEHRADKEPKMDTPWTGWGPHGGIQLAASRGDKRPMGDLQVLDTPPASLQTP
ncbi:MAG: hypothetical protein IPJ19_00630 [Planctomycetes bacterium]|nr:hypothetical protein [Planctomycetota bacterium]